MFFFRYFSIIKRENIDILLFFIFFGYIDEMTKPLYKLTLTSVAVGVQTLIMMLGLTILAIFAN
jgi:hypothetical protein